MKAVLKKVGYEPRDQKATSHEQWVRDGSDGFRKVTVDCPKAPFTDGLLSMMLHQMGMTKKQFYKVLDSL